MAVESIIDAYWQLQDYWTKPRYVLQTTYWPDIDVLAYHPERRHLVIAESKVQRGKSEILTYTSERRNDNQRSFFSWERTVYLKFIDNIEIIRDTVFGNFSTMVRTLTVQLVSNYYLSEDVKREAIDEVQAHVRVVVPNVEVQVLLQTTLEVLCEVIRLDKERGQGKRSGNTVIDIARELNRYMDPEIRNAGRNTNEIKTNLVQPLKHILENAGLLERWR